MAFNKVIRLRRMESGMTLIEFLVAASIFLFLTVIIGSIYFAHFRLFSNQSTAIDVSTQNKLALDEITNQIRQSQAIVSTCTSCGSDTTSASILILQLWPLDANGDNTDPGSSNYDYLDYRQDPSDNTKLIRKTYPGTGSTRPSGTKIIASYISALNFSYDNADPTQAKQVTISLTTTANSGNKTHTLTQSGKADLRNK